MGALHRRFPFYARPAPFALGLLAAALGSSLGLGWDWNWSLQTGNVFLLLMVPRSLVRADAVHLGALAFALLGLVVAFGLGLRTGSAAGRDLERAAGWRRPRFRVFPTVFLFGLFVLYFALAFLFDASVYGDRAPDGYAAFVYLDYAGLLDRPITTGAGLGLLGLALSCLTTLAFERGVGTAPPPVSAPTWAQPPPPAPSAPTRPTAAPNGARGVLGAARRDWGESPSRGRLPAASPRRALEAASASRIRPEPQVPRRPPSARAP
jgi:hypothetical protein